MALSESDLKKVLTESDSGAPYEDRGAVYLYHGGPDGLNTIPAQIVRYRSTLHGRTDVLTSYRTDVLTRYCTGVLTRYCTGVLTSYCTDLLISYCTDVLTIVIAQTY